MCYDIRIGQYRLRHVEEIKITSSVESLADTATIKCPMTVFNKSLSISDKIRPGSTVEISLGYDNVLYREFKGYLKSVQTDGGSLTIECEDELYTFRCDMKDKQYSNVSLKQIVEDLIKTVNAHRSEPLTYECDYSFSYNKFTIATATAFDVLSKLHEETCANMFIQESCLYIQAPYGKMDKDVVRYSMQENIDRDGMNLKWRSLSERKIKIVNKGKDDKGKIISVVVGEAGGDTITMQSKGVTTESNLKRQAQSVYDSKRYEGYEGDFTTWLIPFVTPGCTAQIVDADDNKKDGQYYILSVSTEFGSSGAKRKIGLGKRI